MFEAVIFDCDGVLVDSEIVHLAAEIETLSEYGLTFELSEYKRRFLGLHHAAYFAALDEDATVLLGAPLPPEFRATLADRYRSRLDSLTAIAGAREAIAALGCARAVASSSGVAGLRRKLELTGLFEVFEPHVYSADLVGRGKPHPDIFLYAAEKLGAEPGRCLVIEDSVNGVLAGRAAGMTVWGFAGGGHMDAEAGLRLTEAGAARTVGTWAEAGSIWGRWEKAAAVDPVGPGA